jgi:hypothetical protein
MRSLRYGLSLSAAPAFVLMALLNGLHLGSGSDVLCSAPRGGLPLAGMAPMYLLMGVFHLAPWLRLHSRRRDRRLASTA